jgi:hypothetical protein
MIEKLNGNSLMLIPYGILSTLVVVDLIKKWNNWNKKMK